MSERKIQVLFSLETAFSAIQASWMKSRKNGSASIPREMRGRRHVTVLKGGEKRTAMRWEGKVERKRERPTRDATDDAAKMGKVLKEGRKRESGNGDAMMPVGSCHLLFFSFSRLLRLPLFFSPPFSFSSFSSYSRLHDRRLKSYPRDSQRNYFGSLSSSLYLSPRANSRWHRARSTCSPKILKCDGLFAVVSCGQEIWQRVPFEIGESADRVSHNRFLMKSEFGNPIHVMIYLCWRCLGVLIMKLCLLPRAFQKLSFRFVILLRVRLPRE